MLVEMQCAILGMLVRRWQWQANVGWLSVQTD